MTPWQQFVQHAIEHGATPAHEDRRLIGCYGDRAAEAAALRRGLAVVDRCYRATLEITGKDRLSWLHNLTTNEIKNLAPGEGNYAFACNVKGRILFDLVVLVTDDALWIDLDDRFRDSALAHFEKYRIIENVTISDRTEASARIALVGEAAKACLSEMGAAHAGAMERYAATEIQLDGASVRLFRSDFCGPFAVEFIVPINRAVDSWKRLTDRNGRFRGVPAGDDAVQRCRIEAGVPWPGREITDEYLPGETGQYERAVSRTKGCYLGQEIVERMKSRNVVARRLIGVRLDGTAVPATPAALTRPSGEAVGTLTSACSDVAGDGSLGLAYVKSDAAEAGAVLRVTGGESEVSGRIVALPLSR